jgi:hypothetical protein
MAPKVGGGEAVRTFQETACERGDDRDRVASLRVLEVLLSLCTCTLSFTLSTHTHTLAHTHLHTHKDL